MSQTKETNAAVEAYLESLRSSDPFVLPPDGADIQTSYERGDTFQNKFVTVARMRLPKAVFDAICEDVSWLTKNENAPHIVGPIEYALSQKQRPTSRELQHKIRSERGQRKAEFRKEREDVDRLLQMARR